MDYPKDGERHGAAAEAKVYSKTLPNWAVEYFVLGRVALKVTLSKREAPPMGRPAVLAPTTPVPCSRFLLAPSGAHCCGV